eukprot:TRINITY_DN1780_c1_g1_i1.p2 TRINITY_DN1780_c1_g1~~TRINITY_DN1780_c1_g1_i1.p2  ORF type:complete len:296 (+),score=49.29 TRINITY_DN1780_c1_g1_i1:32-889(+)
MPVHLPDGVFLGVAAVCNGLVHCGLAWWLSDASKVGEGVLAHYAVAVSFFVGIGLMQHNPYGRYAGTGVLGLGGVTANNQLCWIMQEAPAFVAAAWALCYHPSRSVVGTALLCLFAAHYFQRSFVFPLLMRGRKPTAFYVYLCAAGYCGFNGHLMSLALLNMEVGPGRVYEPSFMVGVLMFAVGMYVNIDADQHLRTLRSDPKDTSYHIPRRGMFRWVSGANFFGEILEWGGFALAAQHPAATAFFLTVAGNIGPRALSHHKWYIDKFGEKYTALNRRALIPYVL